MSRWVNASMIVLLALVFLPAATVQAQNPPSCDLSGPQDSGAIYCFTEPHIPWNGGLVIFAHGYVAVDEPLAIPWSQMEFVDAFDNVKYMPDVINDQGFAFATTSYSQNGLAVLQGVEDVRDLVKVFAELHGGIPPAFVLLVGASEGGLVTTLALERYPNDFSGGLAACGPIGSFTGQINYWGDFRVLFDYFMDTPDFDVLPGNASNIPAALMKKWDSVYIPRIGGAMSANPSSIPHLFAVTGAPSYLDPATYVPTTLGILWYNVFATNDAVDKLGGRPYDNFDRVYSDPLYTALDPSINAGVKRFKAQPAALEEIAQKYETSGYLMGPMVTMHTTGDPIVPAWHQGFYTGKVVSNSPYVPYLPITIDRYGHCAFTLEEIQFAFGQLVSMVLFGGMPAVTPMTTLQVEKTPVQVEEPYYYNYR